MVELLPRMTLIKQHTLITPTTFPLPSIKHILYEQKDCFSGLRTVAIAVGSRGITGLCSFVKEAIAILTEWGIEPFIVAAMGSHGNGTIQGQLDVLKALGITSCNMGVPVVASTSVVEFSGKNYSGNVMVNDIAWKADGVLIINRIKKHTDIHSDYESGLLKMIAIGLGNRQQAEVLHSKGLKYLTDNIPRIAQDVLTTNKIRLGIGIVEDSAGRTAIIEAVRPEEFLQAERRLLKLSKEMSAKLPVTDLDVLVIDQGGKNISGSCIETNVIGRMSLMGEDDLVSPRIKRIVVSDLSMESKGNAAGIGLADFITRKFFTKIDFGPTYKNCISCFFPERGKIPIVMETDGQAILSAIETSHFIDKERPRLIRIIDTSHLEYMYVSEAVLEEIQDNPDIEIIASNLLLVDSEECLCDFFKSVTKG